MNESLRRALLRARLSEEDVAARLQVNPKTVRRWLEGRVPYPRHRWLLASALGLDEADLWPQSGASRSRPQEVQAVYPRLEDVPRETWLRLFGDAQERIDILADSGLFLAADPDVLAILADRAAAGVRERICLRDPNLLDVGPQRLTGTSSEEISNAMSRLGSLRTQGDIEVRVHHLVLSGSLYRSDDECLVSSGIYGVQASRAPVIHLRNTGANSLFESYLQAFEDVWASAYSS